jgi:hypothetical protein
MLLNSRKKLLSAFIAAMMLFTLIVPTAISLAGTSRTNGKPFAGSNSFAAEQSGGTVVNSSDDEQWIYLKKGETFESSFDDGFTFTADSDVWINAETGAQSEQVNFADLMNFEPDKVEPFTMKTAIPIPSAHIRHRIRSTASRRHLPNSTTMLPKLRR